MNAPARPVDILVVLGCRTNGDEPGPALLRRLLQARHIQEKWQIPSLLFSGGKIWGPLREAEVMLRWWKRHAQPGLDLQMELDSLTTLENARYSATWLKQHPTARVGLVTCDFHMPRAQLYFAWHGISSLPFPAAHKRAPWTQARLLLRERGALDWTRVTRFFS